MTAGLVLIVQTLFGAVLGVLAVALWNRRGRSGLLSAVFVLVLAAAMLAPAVWNPGQVRTTQRVRVVSVLDGDTTEALVEAFTEETGIVCEVDPFAGGTQTTVGLILQGRIHPDVLLGGTVEIHEELGRAGRLAEFTPPPDAGRIDRYDNGGGHGTPLYLGLLGLVYRPLPSLQTHDPDWVTLIQPRWKSRVAIPSPDKSGGGLVFLATQILRQAEPQPAWDYLGLLDENRVAFTDRSDIPITRVAAGTMDLGVAWAHDVLRRIERERLPVKLRIPDTTGYEVGAASILADARDLDAARRFVSFLTGPQAGRIQAETGFRVPLRTDVEPPRYLDAELLGPEGADRTAFYDRKRVMANKDAWIEEWRRLHPPTP